MDALHPHRRFADRDCNSRLVFGRGIAVSARAAAGLTLLLGGATGNITDRILHGGVTDFFEVWFGSYRYPAFNVADSAITVGAILILLDVLFPRRAATSASAK